MQGGGWFSCCDLCDAAVFDLAEAKQAKAQKFMDDNKLN